MEVSVLDQSLALFCAFATIIIRIKCCIAVEMFCTSYRFSARNLFCFVLYSVLYFLKYKSRTCLVLLWLSFCFQTEQLIIMMEKKEGLSVEILSQDKIA